MDRFLERGIPADRGEERTLAQAVPAVLRVTAAIALLLGSEQAARATTAIRPEPKPSTNELKRQMEEDAPAKQLERLITRIASHRYLTRAEAEQTAATLNLAEFVRVRVAPGRQLATVRVLSNLRHALEMAPKDGAPFPFGLEWDGKRWSVREAPMR